MSFQIFSISKMPTPSNVTNEFIAPMISTIDADLMEMFDNAVDSSYARDDDIDYANMTHIIVDGEILEIYEPSDDDDSPQFNTDDYC